MANRNSGSNGTQVNSCPVTGGGCDKLSCLLSKVGISRSLLVTLALVPFAWNGVVLCASALESVWSVLTTAVNSVAK